VRRIGADGPMTVADYMAACLTDPRHGYYLGRDPLGRSGDFITAPEISQMFGELIGLWCVAAWEALGSPPRFTLAEFGPGRGTLMADALRAAAIRPGFAAGAEIALVEVSPALRAAQADRLRGVAGVRWIEDVGDLPAMPLIAVANEYFDALPIRQFVRTDEGWAERMVGLDADGRLAFQLGPVADAAPGEADVSSLAGETAKPGERSEPLAKRVRSKAAASAVLETSPAAWRIARELATRIVAGGGAALIVDYGHAAPGFGDTLQAVRAHQYDDPLAHPGEADLSAHVDFAALAAAAASAGAAVRPPVDQATFLTRAGIGERAAHLADGKAEETRSSIKAAVDRLTGPDQMGRLFKALAFSSLGLSLPAFDS
jgi:SAM-dependent MidA family methyltransferase